MSATFYVVRHARTAPDGRPSREWQLSEEGERQARELALATFWERVHAIYSSPEPKAVATISPAAARHRLPVVTLGCLREVRRPARWIPDYEAEVRCFFEGAHEGWESLADTRTRMRSCLERILEEAAGDVAVCGHGLSLAAWMSSLSGGQQDPFDLWRSVGFCGVAVVRDGRVVTGFVCPRQVY